MEKFYNTPTGTLCFEDEGLSNDETIVLIHGFPLSKETWNEVSAVLSTSYRVLRYDLTGMGKSTSSNYFVTIDSHVNDLISLMDYCLIEKCTLVGFSMGGYIAIRAVNLFPNRFNSLVLANTKAEADKNDAKEKRFSQVAALRNGDIEKFAGATAGALFSENFKLKHPEMIESLAKLISQNPVEGICGNLMAMAARQDGNEFLKTMGLPTLVITSDNDKVIPHEFGESMVNVFANAQIKQIKDSGHLSIIEQHGAFNDYVKEFLIHLLKLT